jgi:hypothetical protein
MLGSRATTLFNNAGLTLFVFLLPAPPIRAPRFVIRAGAAFAIECVFVILLTDYALHDDLDRTRTFTKLGRQPGVCVTPVVLGPPVVPALPVNENVGMLMFDQ